VEAALLTIKSKSCCMVLLTFAIYYTLRSFSCGGGWLLVNGAFSCAGGRDHKRAEGITSTNLSSAAVWIRGD
jgi:hypothetical protein